LEIARPVAGDNWMDQRPFGISCAATLASDEAEPRLWHGNQALAQKGAWPYPAAMDVGQVNTMADYILKMADEGYKVVTWNGLGFDFDVVQEEASVKARRRALARLALNHWDVGFQMVASKGYMIKLAKAGHGLSVGGKTEAMSGALAPILWSGDWPDVDAETRTSLQEQISALGLAHNKRIEPATEAAQELVLEYVGQDVILTLAVYRGLVTQQYLHWITKAGTRTRRPWMPKIVRGRYGPRLLNVRECLALKEPYTGWMDSPPRPREAYYAWAAGLLGKEGLADTLKPRNV